MVDNTSHQVAESQTIDTTTTFGVHWTAIVGVEYAATFAAVAVGEVVVVVVAIVVAVADIAAVGQDRCVVVVVVLASPIVPSFEVTSLNQQQIGLSQWIAVAYDCLLLLAYWSSFGRQVVSFDGDRLQL